MLIERLTDDVIRDDPLFMSAIERHRILIEEMGWQDTSLVDQYNILVSVCGDNLRG